MTSKRFIHQIFPGRKQNECVQIVTTVCVSVLVIPPRHRGVLESVDRDTNPAHWIVATRMAPARKYDFHFDWWTRHVKHGCPRRQQSQNMAKISKSYILTPPHPQGHVMSVKCEEPIDELTVQVWLLYPHPNFSYCTLFVRGMELRTDRQTDGQTNGQTDRRTIRLLDAPGGPFRPGA